MQKVLLIGGGVIVGVASVLGYMMLSSTPDDVIQPTPSYTEEVAHDETTHSHTEETVKTKPAGETIEEVETVVEKVQEDTSIQTAPASSFLTSYELNDEAYGTHVSVSLTNTDRIIVSNALPNHETGTFPNSGNPNSISEQDNTYTFPLFPTWTGAKKSARIPGVAVNGIKFEPETAEEVVCTSGETYRIEAFQDFADLGFDFNNAHVQPDGTYHYHGVPESLVDSFDAGEDLVHVGFAADGYLIYYSKSAAYKPGYTLSTQKRSGTSCSYRNNSVAINGTTPDGTYISDWVYTGGGATLDACNGTTIDGTYAYLITNEYPFVSRCLNGSFTESLPTGAPPQGGGTLPEGQLPPPPNSGPPPRR